jgi:GNAT superfamily N-acetyltransferase
MMYDNMKPLIQLLAKAHFTKSPLVLAIAAACHLRWVMGAVRPNICEVNLDMRIRKLSHQEIDRVIEFLEAMLDEMTSFGGHILQNSTDSSSNWFRDRVQLQIDAPDHLFLGAELNASSSQLIGILEASIANLPPVFQSKSSLHIHAIYVVPKHRGAGVAKLLMEAAFQWGRSKDCIEADLHVLQNSPAKSLYECLGFEAFQLEMRRKL